MPVKQWQIDMARIVVNIPPDEWGEETEDAMAGILSGVGGGSLAVAVQSHPARIKGVLDHPFRDARPYWIRQPNVAISKRSGPVWLWTENIDMPTSLYLPSFGKMRAVTHLQDWWPYTRWYEAIIELHKHLRISPITHRPAQLAWRVFREFLPYRAWPRLPEEAALFCARALDTYAILKPPVAGLPMAYVYDKRFAYADYLRRFPDFVNGQWAKIDRFASPVGIYETRYGYRSGFWLASLDRQDAVHGGWSWEGDWFSSSPFERFVEWCFAYRGALRSLVRRFPVLVVGKTNAHTYDRATATVLGRATYYPIIFINVVGGLEAEMRKICKSERPHHAFIDSVHLDHPAKTLDIGPAIGQWRLLASGPAIYDGLNRYRVGNFVKHQGISPAQQC